MKKLLIAALMIAGCEQHSQTITVSEQPHGMTHITKIRDCEYIYNDWNSPIVYTHCGDCSNPIHVYNPTPKP